jgi:spore coat protein H
MIAGEGLAMRHACLILSALFLAACTPGDSGSPTDASGNAAPRTVTASGRADPMFSQTVLHEVRIVIDPADWEALRENYRENQYYAANISIDREVVEQVGIRSRGDGSRDPTKPGLKVDFNKYVKSQEFHGYKTLVIDNITQDASLLRERLAYAAYEAMGIAAPQIAHCRLTVNDEYWGVYALIEPISKPFLMNRFREESGNLFDYEYSFDWDFSFLGDDTNEYVPLPFQPETNEDKLDAEALVDFVRTANEAPAEGFAATISRFMDVDQFLTYVATENALAERDGFVGDYGVNNFYLYQYGNSTRFVWIPWDKDTAFIGGQWPLLYNLDTNVLTGKLMADPAKQKVYRDAVVRAVRTAVNPRFLGPRLDQAYQQIRAAALADTKKPHQNDEFESDVQFLRAVIADREGDVMAQAQ